MAIFAPIPSLGYFYCDGFCACGRFRPRRRLYFEIDSDPVGLRFYVLRGNLLLRIPVALHAAHRTANLYPAHKIAFGVEFVYTFIGIILIHMKNIDGVEVFLLRSFAALMAQRSVSRAADTLNTSQPAVSKALARLRDLFEDPLLIRAHGRMVPTDRALELDDPVRRILADLATVIESPRSVDPQTARITFRLTAPETVEHLILPRLIAHLEKTAPGVRVEARHPSRDQALRWLETGEIDFRLGWLERPPQALHSAILYRDRLVCLARKDHPEIDGRISLEQYLSLPHARLEVAPHGMSGRAIDRAVAKLGHKLRISLVVQNYGTVLHTVARSNLIATVSERMIKSSAPHLGLQVLDPPLRLPETRINMFWHQRTHKDSRHRWFRQQISAIAREL